MTNPTIEDFDEWLSLAKEALTATADARAEIAAMQEKSEWPTRWRRVWCQ
jgi:hypothetical protein